ncbi:DUF2256 domain-containing protein [uncultured Planktomarina sp.]|uniref:DUF2256 domain-containing protein n=1 Tax=uncultured Planktomarina sp. TaxID=1538529 RepID=UPI00326170F9
MKMRKKSDLPSKICRTCARPYVWRKKWAKTWNEVQYCSDKCRKLRPPAVGVTDDDGAN